MLAVAGAALVELQTCGLDLWIAVFHCSDMV
jgi:hypothetical protein